LFFFHLPRDVCSPFWTLLFKSTEKGRFLFLHHIWTTTFSKTNSPSRTLQLGTWHPTNWYLSLLSLTFHQSLSLFLSFFFSFFLSFLSLSLSLALSLRFLFRWWISFFYLYNEKNLIILTNKRFWEMILRLLLHNTRDVVSLFVFDVFSCLKLGFRKAGEWEERISYPLHYPNNWKSKDPRQTDQE
jgi:hypothetical protein